MYIVKEILTHTIYGVKLYLNLIFAVFSHCK